MPEKIKSKEKEVNDMSRWKGKMRKTKKILIRVDVNDKTMAEELSKAAGKNTSEFFRMLLNEYQNRLTLREEIAHQFKIHVENYAITKR